MSRKTLCILGMLFALCATVTEVNCRIQEYNETFLEKTLHFIEDNILITRVNEQAEVAESPLDEFPEIFTDAELRSGWVVLHVFAAVYFFCLLAIVCGDYFLPTVECLCEDLHLSKDVAAATFMATATTMPEFFTNTISVLITDSDMGVGTVIGSLMFNTLGVAGCAALAISKPVQLDWWPIARDCVIYSFNTILLFILAFGNNITFVESCVMILFLILYYVLTFNNNKFMPAIRVFVEDKLNCCLSTRYDFTEPPENSAKAQLPIKKEHFDGDGVFAISLPDNSSFVSSTVNLTKSKSWNDKDSESTMSVKSQTVWSPCSLPRGQSVASQMWWYFTFPIQFLLMCIIPNPITNRRFYPLTFIMCICVIGGNAYMIVWMLTAFGVAIHVPEIIMGMTFLAAGSNMPEAVSSIISLRSGENGIGVSNSLGANSLAILLSMGVPWFAKNVKLYVQTGSPSSIVLSSGNIELNIIILLLCTIALFITLSLTGYRLKKTAGIALFTTYTIFLAIQILIEMRILFPMDISF